GLTSRNQIAVMLSDQDDEKGLLRYVITADEVTEARIKSEDSACEDQAVAFLEWFVTAHPCKQYISVFLNHGGTLDQMCLDIHPGKSKQEWMSGQVLGRKLRDLRKRTGVSWELLFFQQCGRGSLENLYSF